MERISPPSSRTEQQMRLEQRKSVLEDYLRMKVDEQDWHGVQDAASDLRDIDSEIKGLKF